MSASASKASQTALEKSTKKTDMIMSQEEIKRRIQQRTNGSSAVKPINGGSGASSAADPTAALPKASDLQKVLANESHQVIRTPPPPAAAVVEPTKAPTPKKEEPASVAPALQKSADTKKEKVNNKVARKLDIIDDEAEKSGDGHESDDELAADVDDNGNIKDLIAGDDEDVVMEDASSEDEGEDKKKKKKKNKNRHPNSLDAIRRAAEAEEEMRLAASFYSKGGAHKRVDALKKIAGSKIGNLEEAIKEMHGDDFNLDALEQEELKEREAEEGEVDDDDGGSVNLSSEGDGDDGHNSDADVDLDAITDARLEAMSLERLKELQQQRAKKPVISTSLNDLDDEAEPPVIAALPQPKDEQLDAMDIDEPVPAAAAPPPKKPLVAPTLQTSATLNRKTICQTATAKVMENMFKQPLVQRFLKDEIDGKTVSAVVEALYTDVEAGPMQAGSNSNVAKRVRDQVKTYLNDYTAHTNDVVRMAKNANEAFPSATHVGRLMLLGPLLASCPISVVENCKARKDGLCALTGEKYSAGSTIHVLVIKAGDTIQHMPISVSAHMALRHMKPPATAAPSATSTPTKPAAAPASPAKKTALERVPTASTISLSQVQEIKEANADEDEPMPDAEPEPEAEEDVELARPETIRERAREGWTIIRVKNPSLTSHWIRSVAGLASVNHNLVAYAVKAGEKPPAYFDAKGFPDITGFPWAHRSLIAMMDSLFTLEEVNKNEGAPKTITGKRVETKAKFPIYLDDKGVSEQDSDTLWAAFETANAALLTWLFKVYQDDPKPKVVDSLRLNEQPFWIIGTKLFNPDSAEARALFPLASKDASAPAKLDVMKHRFFPRLLCHLFVPKPVYYVVAK